MANDTQDTNLIAIAERIVTAWISKNEVSLEDVDRVFSTIWRSVSTLGSLSSSAEGSAWPEQASQTTEPLVPAVEIDKSVTPERIICLEDGKSFTMLKRHLKTTYGMTPDQYRAKWGLNPSYPMTAPNYAETRSKLAKKMGLGRSRTADAQATPASPAPKKAASASKTRSARTVSSRSTQKKPTSTAATRRSSRSNSAATAH